MGNRKNRRPAYAEELEKALEKEKDEEAKLEIEKGIELLKASGMTKQGLS